VSATPTRAVVAALIRKDLRRELRTQESLPAMALFSVTTFVLFHFGLDARSLEGDLAAGVFWVTMLFAAVLAINRQFVAEREEGGFDGFLLAPVDRTALFVAKAAVLFGFLVALQVVAVPEHSRVCVTVTALVATPACDAASVWISVALNAEPFIIDISSPRLTPC